MLSVGLTLLLPAAACAQAAAPASKPQSTGPANVTEHAIPPSAVNPSLEGPSSPYLAFVSPRRNANGRLFVFLAGSGGSPSCCQLLLRQAAASGYLVIGLTYDNQTTVGVRCLNDLACYGTVRRNVFDGSDPSAYSAIPRQDGVEQRLTGLLAYLAYHYPAEGWGALERRGAPRWGQIVLGGHSQGGGEAAFIGTVRPLRGEVTLSSPPDTDSLHRPATWVKGVDRGKTPVSRIVGFVHHGDPFYPRIAPDWSAMDLQRFGPMEDVDTLAAPYRGSHELISYASLPPVVLATHDSTAVDSATPRCASGSPRYAPVWDYMLEVAGGLRLTRQTNSCG
jgi:hypothetical protein